MAVNRIMSRIKARIKSRTVLALIFGAFLVLYGILGVRSWEMAKQRQALEADIAILSTGIRGPIPTTDAQLSGMEPALERLERASDLFPEQLKVSQAVEGILALASRSSAKVTALQEKAPSTEVVGDHDYYSRLFTLEAEGPLENVLDLITRIEQGEEGPMVLQRVSLGRTGETYITSLDLAFYTRSRTEAVPKPKAVTGGR